MIWRKVSLAISRSVLKNGARDVTPVMDAVTRLRNAGVLYALLSLRPFLFSHNTPHEAHEETDPFRGISSRRQ